MQIEGRYNAYRDAYDRAGATNMVMVDISME